MFYAILNEIIFLIVAWSFDWKIAGAIKVFWFSPCIDTIFDAINYFSAPGANEHILINVQFMFKKKKKLGWLFIS